MKGLFWLVAFGFVLTAAGIVWYVLRKFRERQLAEEARMASFLAATAGNAGKPRLVEALPTPLPEAVAPAGNDLVQQKLLFEAAHKAGEAGEAALAIQLYARLLARYPASTFVPQARAAVETQKKKLVKA
jgi:hypothetical protein